MNILSLFPAIPLLMMLGLWISKNLRQIHAVMVTGASALLALSVALVVMYLGMRADGRIAAMLFTGGFTWYAPLNIRYDVGVDGISVAMLLLSSVIVFTGTFASWKMTDGAKEFFMWFCLLSVGVFGFFIPLQKVWFPIVFIGFGVLGALFPFHTWSPDGHASAPTAVSMLHAGVLMKLGGYGCFRVAMFLLPDAAQELSWIFIILTAVSVVYGAFSACVQTDLKYINAYSSVSHCGLVLFAILMMNTTAATGAVLQMLSHGLMTALFFALIGMIYGRTHTRDIRELSGLMRIMPFLSVCYVIAGLANLGLPGLSGFVAEMTIFNGAFMENDTFHRVVTVIACTSIVITAVYILRLIGKILYGTCTNPEHLKLTDATWDERLAVIVLIVCIAGLGLAPMWVSGMISDSVIPMISHILN